MPAVSNSTGKGFAARADGAASAAMMRERSIGDPYDRIKRAENEAALAHLPAVLRVLDGAPDDGVVELLLRGLLAGNKFDLGAKETTEQHARGELDFFKTLDDLGERPWFVDDVAHIEERLRRVSPGWFSGCDVIRQGHASGDDPERRS